MVAVESLAVTGAVAPCGPEGFCIRTTVVSLLKSLASITGSTDRLDACNARNPYADPLGGIDHYDGSTRRFRSLSSKSLIIASRPGRLNFGPDARAVITDGGPDVRAEHDQGKRAARQVLLIRDVLMRRHHHVETRRFRLL